MKELKKTAYLLVIALFLTTSSLVFAGGKERGQTPLQIQGMGTYPLGSGVSVGLHLAEVLYIGAESLSGSHSDSETVEGDYGTETYDWKIDLKTTLFILRLSPFSGSGFYLQAGSVNRDWKYVLNFKSQIGDSVQVETGSAVVKWPTSGTNTALGWNWIAGNLSWGFGIGKIEGAAPTVEVTLDNPALQASLQADIDKEEEEINEKLKQFKSIPYGFLHLGLNF